MRTDREVSASVSRRVELQVPVPVDILLYLSADGSVGEPTGFVHLRIPARQIIVQFELRVGVQVEADAGIDGSHHPVAVPGLRLDENAVRDDPFVDRVARLHRIDEPVLVVIVLLGDEVSVFIAVVALVRIGFVQVGVDLAPRTVLERMAHIDGRQTRHREVALGQALQRNAVGLGHEEGVVAVGVLGLGIGQAHRHTRSHAERRVGNGPRSDHAAVLLLFDVVVVVTRMDRVAAARMAHGQREVVILGPRPEILPAGAARLVVDVEARRRGDVLCDHDAEILLPVTLLTRLRVVHPDHRPLRVVEGHVLHVVGVRVVGARKTEVKELGSPEIVQRQRRLPEGSLCDVAHILPIERIVDPVIGEHGVQRTDLHAVEIALHVPHEVVQRADRIAEEVRLQRFSDFPFLFGGILGLLTLLAFGLLVGVRPVERPGLSGLHGTLQGAGIEILGPQRKRSDREHSQQECQQYPVRASRHSQRAENRGKGN